MQGLARGAVWGYLVGMDAKINSQKLIQFFRFTLQGISIASYGTMGLTPEWGSFILGTMALLGALALLTIEKEA